jgi:hypothetical protein
VESGIKTEENIEDYIYADINAALNIARRLGYRVRVSRKIESYHVTHSGVKPLNPRQRANTRDPSIETPPFRAGRVSYSW